jgi:hypothetical protein
LNGGFEKLFELNTTALILDEALSTRYAERERRANRVVATRRVKEVESVASARNGNGKGADMGSVWSLATFAIWVLCFVAFPDESEANFRYCSAFAERAGASPVMRSAFRVCPKVEPKLLDCQERERCL